MRWSMNLPLYQGFAKKKKKKNPHCPTPLAPPAPQEEHCLFWGGAGGQGKRAGGPGCQTPATGKPAGQFPNERGFAEEKRVSRFVASEVHTHARSLSLSYSNAIDESVAGILSASREVVVQRSGYFGFSFSMPVCIFGELFFL